MAPESPRSSSGSDRARSESVNESSRSESGRASSPLDRGTKLAVQASLRYHGRKR